MAKIGDIAELMVLKKVQAGLYLDAGELGEVLLPHREVSSDLQIDSQVKVFLYRDSEDRAIATTRTPRALPGQFARLKCKEVTSVGAFLDWGLQKDLLLPFREQKDRAVVGKSYFVKVMIDAQTDRLMASARVNRHLDKSPSSFQQAQEVELTIFAKTDLGYKAIINGEHTGLLYANEVFRELETGEKIQGWIAAIRGDGKIDLTMQPPGRDRISTLENELLGELIARGGYLPLHDKSSAEEIKQELGVSKRTFKQAVGALLKKRLITTEDKGIRLN